VIELQLLAGLLQFQNAPAVNRGTEAFLDGYYSGDLRAGMYRDELTRELLDYNALLGDPRHGLSNLHIGHLDPNVRPRHIPSNVSWRTDKSNLVQGDMTLFEAKLWLLALLGRYLELGEATVQPDA
jgi:hypothetical protein